MITVRELSGSRNVKFFRGISLQLMRIKVAELGLARRGSMPKLFGYGEALEKLTFQLDRDIVQRALDVISNTFLKPRESSTS